MERNIFTGLTKGQRRKSDRLFSVLLRKTDKEDLGTGSTLKTDLYSGSHQAVFSIVSQWEEQVI